MNTKSDTFEGAEQLGADALAPAVAVLPVAVAAEALQQPDPNPSAGGRYSRGADGSLTPILDTLE